MPDESAISSVHGLIGDAGFERLCAAFYRQVPSDDLLGPLYPADDLAGAEYRLRSFLVFRFGGPDRYLQERGHPQLRMRHAPFAIDQNVRDRWVTLMDRAIVEAELPVAAASILRPFLHEVATFLINRGSKPNMVS
jgi:hemoglobin